MKNITVLTVLVITLFSFLSLNAVYAEDQPEKYYSFSFGVSFGFVYGQSVELVYPTNTPAKYLSELLWDIKPVYYLGLQADFERANIKNTLGFFASLTFNIGIPSVTGIMEDRDWTNQNNTSLTHYSRHTNKTNEFFWLDAASGILIPLNKYLYIKTYLTGSWMRFVFTGRDGYGKYPSGNLSFEGQEVIRYEQNWFILAAGLSLGTKNIFPLSFELSFLISPLIYAIARDNHYKRNLTFNDYMSFGLYMEPKAGISFSINRINLSMEFLYRYIGGTKGFSNVTGSGKPYTDANKPGAGLYLINARFIITFKF